MKEIFEILVKGNPLERLSVISNLATILGVSVATFVAGPFLQNFANQEFIISDFILSVIFYSTYILLSIKAILHFATPVINAITERKFKALPAALLTLLATLAILAALFSPAKYYTGRTLGLDYLLPKPANISIEKIINTQHNSTDTEVTFKGTLKLSSNIASDYDVLLYRKSDQGLYSPTKLANSKYSVTPNSDGSFSLPVDASRGIIINDPHILIFRKSDWSLLSVFFMRDSGYPEKATQLPDRDIERLRPFILKL